MTVNVLKVLFTLFYYVGCLAFGLGAGDIARGLIGNDASFFAFLAILVVIFPVPMMCLVLGYSRSIDLVEKWFGPKEVDQT